jgi:hypothetical protein
MADICFGIWGQMGQTPTFGSPYALRLVLFPTQMSYCSCRIWEKGDRVGYVIFSPNSENSKPDLNEPGGTASLLSSA